MLSTVSNRPADLAASLPLCTRCEPRIVPYCVSVHSRPNPFARLWTVQDGLAFRTGQLRSTLQGPFDCGGAFASAAELSFSISSASASRRFVGRTARASSAGAAFTVDVADL